MNAAQVQAAVQKWENEVFNGKAVALGAQADLAGHIRAFEAGMSALVAARAADAGPTLGLALPFGPVERGAVESYRRALKKYTNSTVWEDLRLHLLLVREDGMFEVIAPEMIHDLLAGLDRHIAAYKRGNA
jgi:hypothetical protein